MKELQMLVAQLADEKTKVSLYDVLLAIAKISEEQQEEIVRLKRRVKLLEEVSDGHVL